MSTSKIGLLLEITVTAVILALIVLSLTGSFMFAVVEGRSMEPLLQTGDLVFVIKVDPQEIHVGDVVVYQKPTGEYVIHRVINVLKSGDNILIVTKGDNNPVPDGKIPAEWVAGKVVDVGGSIIKVPGIGYITLCFKSLVRANN